MAVNGVEIKVGQRWRNLLGDQVTVLAENVSDGWPDLYPWRVDGERGLTYSVDGDGVAELSPRALSLCRLIVDVQTPETTDPAPTDTKDTNPKDAVGVRKAPMSTVSAAVLAEIGVAMLEGAAKYGRHNYRAMGVRSSVYYDSTMRHLMSWWEGENFDPDSGMSHITKAITSLVVLRDAMIQGMLTDDRAPMSANFYERLNAQAAAIIDRHADKSPRHYTIADSKVNAS